MVSKLLEACPEPARFVVNVSAMEGKFYRYKTPNHPHTNMAKAALNMMTRTSAPELASRLRIYMTAVDTGWINDENPRDKAARRLWDELNKFKKLNGRWTTELRLPPSSGYLRACAHDFAERLGLLHTSTGEGSGRTVVVQVQPPPEAAGKKPPAPNPGLQLLGLRATPPPLRGGGAACCAPLV